MTTIVTRTTVGSNTGKGSPLTHTEVDTNFVNLNTAKLETAAIPLGTLQAPSVSFLNDSDTGIFCPQGGNSLAIATGGQYAITCTSTQAVGIKTANPQKALHVAGPTRVGADDATDAFLEIGEGATGNRNSYIDIVADTTYTDYGLRIIRNNTGANATSELKHRGTGALNFTTQEAAPIEFYTTNSPRVAIDSSGRLLVGTSTQQGDHYLQVEGSATSSSYPGSIFLRRGLANASIGSGNQLGAIDFGNQDGGKGATIFAEGDAQWGTNDYPGRLVFSTNPGSPATGPTERMRINNSGRLDAWGGSAVNSFNLVTQAAAGTTYYLIYGGYSSSGAGNYGTQSFGVWSNGNVINTNNSYLGISDAKLKENIVDANSQWNDLKALQVRNFNFKEGQTHTQIGLVAQEVEEVSPGLVSQSPDRDAEGNDLGTVTKSVNYSVLYMKAVKALQEAMERIEQLEAEMAAVKSQLS